MKNVRILVWPVNVIFDTITQKTSIKSFSPFFDLLEFNTLSANNRDYIGEEFFK